MSLQVWLPLTSETIENKGTSNLDFSTSVAMDLVDDGKIGKCYYRNGSGVIRSELFNVSSTTQMSICIWTKMPVDYTTNGYIGGLTAGTSSNFMFYNVGATSIRLYIDGSYRISYTHGWAANEWHHLSATYDGAVANLYIDGALVGTATGSWTIPQEERIMLGGRSNNASGQLGVQRNNYYNDFRYYDNCLSAAEVKEISQGLVLHYKLDDDKENQWNYNATIPANNVYSNPTFESGSGWSHWGQSGSSHSSGQNSDKQYIFNKNYSYSHYISEDAGTEKYYYLYQTKDSPGGARSLQCILKEENSIPITSSIVQPTLNSRTGGAAAGIWTSIKYLGDGFYYCKYENVIQSQQTGTNALFGIRVYSGYKIYVSEMYLENSETCTSIFSNDIIQDSSGYEHNGQEINSPILTSNSIRYSFAKQFNGTDQYIRCFRGGMVRDSITVNIWGYQETWEASPGRMVSCTQTGGWNFEESNSQIVFACGIGESTNTYKNASWGNHSFSMLSSGWHMFTGTYDGYITKLYVDGELVASSSTNTEKIPLFYHTSNGVFIGAEAGTNQNTPTTPYFNGILSDFRIYATALTNDDILTLYHTAAKIDNLQNLHTFELIEDNSKISLTKNGQLKCDELEENISTKFYDTNIIETNTLIER